MLNTMGVSLLSLGKSENRTNFSSNNLHHGKIASAFTNFRLVWHNATSKEHQISIELRTVVN